MSKKPRDNRNTEKKKVEQPKATFIKKYAHSLFIFMLSALLYANSISNDYNLDDELVTQNHRLTSKGISAISEIFTEPYYKDNMGYSYEYRPIVLVSFAIEHDFFGDNPHVSHFFNMLLYSLLCVILFISLKKLLGDRYLLLAFLTTLVFCAHPTHTEIVSSIKNRDEILSLFFALSALLYGIKYAETGKGASAIISFLLFTLALLSKLTVTSFIIFIPLALVLFKDIKMKSLLLLCFLYAIPLFILSNINLLIDRFMFIGGAIVLNVFFFYIKNGTFPLGILKHKIVSFFNHLKLNFADYKESFDGIKLLTNYGIFYALIFIGVLVAAMIQYFKMNPFDFKLLLILSFAIWLFALWEWKVVFSVFYVGLFFFISKDIHLPDSFPNAILLFPFFFVAFHSKGFQKWMFLSIAIILLLSGLLTYKWTRYAFLYLPIGIVFFHEKLSSYKKYAIVISGLFFTWVLIKKISSGILNLDFFFPIMLLTWLIGTYKTKLKSPLPFAFATMLLIIIINTNNKVITPRNNLDLDMPKMEVQQINAPKIIESVNRPLNFVETPVDHTSSLNIKLGTSMDIWMKYLRLTILPYPLSFYYGYSYIKPVSVFNLFAIFTLLFHIGLGIVALLLMRKKPIISFGLLIYLLSIASFSPLFTTLPGMMADRYLLIPSIGFSMLLVYAILYFTNKDNYSEIFLPKLITPKIIIIIVIAIYSGITIARNFDWKDRVTLFTKDIENVSNSSQAHNLLAAHLGIKANEASTPEEKKRIYELSVEHFKKSLEIYPDYLNPTFDLGRTLIVLGRYDEAIAAFENAVRIKPSYSVSYTNLGLLMDNNGNLEAAVDNYKKSIERNPRNLTVYNNLSYAYFRLEKYNESININKKAIEQFPSAYQPYVNIGKTYLIQRNLDSALVYLEQGYQYNQNDYDMTNLLYQICLSKNDTKGLFYGNRLKSLQKP